MLPGWVLAALAVAVAVAAGVQRPREAILVNSAPATRHTASVSLAPFTVRRVGGVSRLERSTFFNVHSSPLQSEWPEEDAELFAGEMQSHLGRDFDITQRMSACVDDPQRPGYVDEQSLIEACTTTGQLNNWPSSHVNLVLSAKTELLYANGCGIATPIWVPGSHDAAADYFSKFLQHCTNGSYSSEDKTRRVHLVEVANECDVKVGGCNTTWDEMVQLHVAIARRLHSDYGTPPRHELAGASVRSAAKATTPLVCGPTASWPEYQANNFSEWHKHMGAFVSGAGRDVDCLSVHMYSYFYAGELQAEGNRIGSNVLAIMDLQETFSFSQLDYVLPLVVSEFGGTVRVKPNDTSAAVDDEGEEDMLLTGPSYGYEDLDPSRDAVDEGREDNASGLAYSPMNDFAIIQGVNGKLMSFLDRPDRILRVVPFITAKSVWFKNTYSDPTHSYPYVLWRYDNSTETRSHDGHTGTWTPTHLQKFYELWAAVRGDMRLVSSSDANLQVQLYAAQDSDMQDSDRNGATVFVLLNNLRPSSVSVKLRWDGCRLDSNYDVTTTRLFYDADRSMPVLHRYHETMPAPPHLTMRPLEFVMLQLEAVQPAQLDPDRTTEAVVAVVNERTLYSRDMLQRLDCSGTVFRFNLAPQIQRHEAGEDEHQVQPMMGMDIRMSFGGNATRFPEAMQRLRLSLNGIPLPPVELTTQMAGRMRVYAAQNAMFGAVTVSVPVAALKRMAAIDNKGQDLEVLLHCEPDGDDPFDPQLVVSSVVLVTRTPW